MGLTKETNEQLIARKEIKAAVENLLQACNNNHAAFAGFVWSVEPMMIIRFGNVTEQGSDFTTLILKLNEVVTEKKDAGLIVNDPLTGTNENSFSN